MMISPIKEPKTDYKFLVALIIGAWFFYTLYTTPVYVQFDCTKYSNNTGFCNLALYKVLSVEKKTFNINEITGVDLKKDQNNSRSSPSLFLNTPTQQVMLMPNYFMDSSEASQYESQINSVLKNNGPANLKIQKDAILISILALGLVAGLIIYTFKDYFFPKKR